MPEILQPNEVYIASRSRMNGALRAEGRFKIAENTSVIETLEGLNPPTIAIGEQGRDTQPQASTVTISDLTDGLGVRWNRQDASDRRFYFATLDTRYRRQITLLPHKTDMGAPSGIDPTGHLPGAGGVWHDRVYVAWGATLRSWVEPSGWSDGTHVNDHSFFGGGIPTGDPVKFCDAWFWPLDGQGIDYLNPTGWDHIALPCVGLLSLVDRLYAVSADGLVSMISLSTSDAACAAGTLVAGDFTTIVEIDDVCRGITAYTTSGVGSDIVPYVLGERRLYEIDPTESSALAAGPAELPPNVWPMMVTPLPTTNSLYVAQGMGVLEWNNNIVSPIGLDNDDGVPVEWMGGITKIIPGFENLYALIFGTRAGLPLERDIYGSGADLDDGVLWGVEGQTWLATYEGNGWHTRAVSTGTQTDVNTCLFLSDSEDTYRVWFAFGPTLYSMDIEINVFNPLDNPDTQYEATGFLLTSHYDFNFLLEEKIGLMIQIQAIGCGSGCTITPYLILDDATNLPLYDTHGNSTITTTGVHTFLVHADTIGPLFNDQPAVGKPFSTAAVRCEMVGTLDRSPAIKAIIIHAIKANVPVRGWQVTLDLAQPHMDNLSAWQQRQLLLGMLEDASHGLLHFGYLPDPANGSTVQLYPVMPTVVAFSSPTGEAYAHQTRVRLAFVEGYRVVPPEVASG
jgi:hypothetical protein